jgi:guanylate kinase
MINNKLFLLVGHSGSGKTKITEELFQYGYSSIPSFTTRPPRYDNETGHIFITDEEYEKLKRDMAAYTYFNNHHYFTTLQQIYSPLYALYVVDPDGIDYLKKTVKGVEFITIYIKVREFDRINRMYTRGDSREKIESRIKNDIKKFSNLTFDYAVPNNNLDKTVTIIKNIIEEELK